MKTNKFINAALFISLAVNVFMIMTAVGHSASAAHQFTYDTQVQDEKLRESLPSADKQVLKEVMDANREKVTTAYSDMIGMKKDIIKLIMKEPMDEKALDATLQKEKSKKLAFIWLMHETRQEAMKKMSPEGRAALSKMTRLGFNLESSQCR